jgi:hypothetical protein
VEEPQLLLGFKDADGNVEVSVATSDRVMEVMSQNTSLSAKFSAIHKEYMELAREIGEGTWEIRFDGGDPKGEDEKEDQEEDSDVEVDVCQVLFELKEPVVIKGDQFKPDSEIAELTLWPGGLQIVGRKGTKRTFQRIMASMELGPASPPTSQVSVRPESPVI